MRKIAVVGSYQLNDGGHPFENDDIAWLQGGISETLADVVKSFLPAGTDFCILQGFDMTTANNQTTISSGIVYYQGEIYAYAGQTFAFTVVAQGFELYVDQATPKGNRDYANGQTHVVHVYETMKVRAESTGVPSTNELCLVNIVNGAGPQLSKFLSTKLDFDTLKDRLVSDWFEVGGQGGGTFNAATSGNVSGFPVKWRLHKVENELEFIGRLNYSGGSPYDPLSISLPAGAHVSVQRVFQRMGKRNIEPQTNSQYNLRFDTNGQIAVFKVDGTDDHQGGIVLDGLRVPL